MFGYSLFNPLTDRNLRENSANGVEEVLSSRYNVSRVRATGAGKYNVYLNDGSCMTVKTGKKIGLFGEEKSFIKFIEE
jgi:hypothetical protein